MLRAKSVDMDATEMRMATPQGKDALSDCGGASRRREVRSASGSAMRFAGIDELPNVGREQGAAPDRARRAIGIEQGGKRKAIPVACNPFGQRAGGRGRNLRKSRAGRPVDPGKDDRHGRRGRRQGRKCLQFCAARRTPVGAEQDNAPWGRCGFGASDSVVRNDSCK